MKNKASLKYEISMLDQKVQNTIMSYGVNSEQHLKCKEEIKNEQIKLKKELKELEDNEPETYLTIMRNLDKYTK